MFGLLLLSPPLPSMLMHAVQSSENGGRFFTLLGKSKLAAIPMR
jgi:hypothetical protein